MFINIKYLVITVVSIFLALGVGILIGTQLDSQDLILEQQTITVQKMEGRVEELNRQNSDLQNELKQFITLDEINNNYIKNIFPDYVKNKLIDQKVVIIETSEEYAFNNMRQALKIAGANISSITLNSDRLTSLSDEEQDELKVYLNTKENNLIPVILKKITEVLTGKNSLENLELLKEKGLIYVNGAFDGHADHVVLAGGSKEKTNRYELIDLPLIREIKKHSIPIVGVEVSDAQVSYMDYYKKEKLSTVDNIDTIIGQTSLILVMTGKEGNYGIKKTASALMPFVSEEEQPK